MNEIQVKTAGYEAEYGQSTGGVVNVLTKSGSNSLRGSVFGYARPSALEGEFKQIQTENGSINTSGTQTSDAGFTVGGPVLRDRIFFFGAYNPSWETRTITAPAGFPLESLGEVDRKRHIDWYSAKGSVQLGNGHRVDASFFGDPAKGDMGPQRLSSLVRTDTSAFSSTRYGGHNQTLKYDGVIRPSWLVEATFSRAKNNLQEFPSVNSFQIQDTTVVPNIVSGGIGFYEAGNEGINLQYQAKSTHIFGGHQIRYGVLYEDIEYNNINQFTGPTFTLSDGQQTATGASVRVLSDPNVGKIYRAIRANLNTNRATTSSTPASSRRTRGGWATGSRFDPGIRYEQQKLVGTVDGLQAGGQLGATHRRHLRRARERPLEAVWQLGPLLRQGAERSRGPCAVGRRWHDARGLLRCRADAADSRRACPPARDLETRPPELRRASPPDIRSEREVHLPRTRRWSGSSSSR